MSTNLPKFSARARKAIDILADGGSFVHRLERNSYTRREQFAYRLLNDCGNVVRGVGVHAFYELKDAGMLRMRESGNTSVSTYYRLNVEC